MGLHPPSVRSFAFSRSLWWGQCHGQKPTAIIEIGIWVKDYHEIDLFDWQDAVPGMLTVSQVEVELAASEGLVRRAVERGQVAPDHTLELGDRTYHYFTRERIPEIRAALDLPEVNVGTPAGQTIPHVHVHLIPRYSADVVEPIGGVRNVIPGRGKYPFA